MIRAAWRFLLALYKRTVYEDDCPGLAASMSFYALLSFLPFIILAVSISSFFLASSEAAFVRIQNLLMQALPVSTVSSLELLHTTVAKKTVFGIVGLVGLLWGSMRVFAVIEQAMGRIWAPGFRRRYWESRFVALVSVPLLSILLLLSVVLTGFTRVAKRTTIPYLDFSLSDIPGAAALLTMLLPVVISAILFLSLYYLVPKRWDHFRSALYGALLAAFLWEGAKLLFDYYIEHFSHLDTIYGSFASLAILFLWIYYSSFVVLLGAEFGAMLQRYKKKEPAPAPSHGNESSR